MNAKDHLHQSVFRPFRKEKAGLFLQCTLAVLLSLSIPFALSRLVDSAAAGKGTEALLKYAALAALAIAGEFFANWWQNNHWHSFMRKCVAALRGAAFSRLLFKPLSYFEQRASGDVLNRLLNDTEMYAQNQAVNTLMLLLNLIRIGGILALMFALHVPLAVLVSLFLPCYYAFFHWLNRYLRKANRKERESYSEVLHSAQEKVQGIETIHFYQKQRFISAIFTKALQNHHEFSKRLIFFRTLGLAVNGLMLALLPLAVVFAGGMMLQEGALSVGVLVAFYAYLPYLHEPVNNLSDWNLGRQGALAVQERVWELFEADEKEQAAHGIDAVHSIRFDGIGFSYGQERPLIRDFSCEIRAGDRVAIVGHSGIGKSTLIKLILRQVQPNRGRIWINGELELSGIDQPAWYHKIAYLAQNPFLFEATVLENLAFDEAPDQQDLIAALSIADVDAFCPPGKVGTTAVSQGGGNFSGGEKQRVALARALLKQADVLLLDEATAALDMAIEQKVVSGLERYLREHPKKILVSVSHRPEIMRLCNKVIEFSGEGEVAVRNA